MNLLQQKLIELTGSEEFVSLEFFRDELLNSHLNEFDKLVELKHDSYSSNTLFHTEKFEIRLLCWKPFQETLRHLHP